jgi:hypothetical protein
VKYNLLFITVHRTPTDNAEHSVHPTGGTPRVSVFKQFLWLSVGSDKATLPRPAHQLATKPIAYVTRI